LLLTEPGLRTPVAGSMKANGLGTLTYVEL